MALSLSARGNGVLEGQIHHFRALAQPPVIRFLARQTGAVHSGLLSRAHADGLAILHIAHGIGLGVFQDNQGNLHIPFRFLRQRFVLCDDIGDQRVVDGQLLAALLKGHPVYLFVLQRRRHKIPDRSGSRCNFLFSCGKNFQRLFGLKPGAITPSDTSLLISMAVSLSHSSDRAMKSPKEDIRSAPLALA